MHDLRFALRTLNKSPGYTAAVVFTLALGIGSATAIFSVADRVLFRPPPYPEPEQLVVLGFKHKDFGVLQTQLPAEVAAYRETARSFQSFAALQPQTVNVVIGEQPRGSSIGCVSLDYFSTLGAVPILGRTFIPGEDRPGADGVVVLSHRLWREQFGSDPGVLNRTLLVNGAVCRVVGVLGTDFRPPRFHYVELYRPFSEPIDPARPFGSMMYVLARLRPGATAAQAEAEMRSVNLPVNAASAKRLAERPRIAQPLLQASASKTDGTYWALLAAVGCLYAIACVNAGNLMLARLQGRQRELVIRLAIGGSQRQLARLLLTENLLLAAFAGAGGLLVAQWLFPALLRFAPASGAAFSRGAVDWRALAFTGVLTLFTTLLVSLVPILRLRQTRLNEGLNEGAHALGEGRRLRRARSVLVVTEAALAVVLLVGAGLMIRTVRQLDRIDRGFDPTNKMAVWLQIPRSAYRAPDARRIFFEQLEEQIRAVPGVTGVAITNVAPLAGRSLGNLKKPDGTEFYAGMFAVTPGYNRLLGMRVLKGRWFDDAVVGGAPLVVINESMAREYFGDRDPIGQPFQFAKDPWQVIGVVQDINDRPREKSQPQLFFPYWQRNDMDVATLLLRTNQPLSPIMTDAVRKAVYRVNPLIATMSPQVLSQNAQSQAAHERYTLTVLQVLSALALGLAVAGLFAIMAYGVAERMGEFGVRMALGALPEQLFRLVLGRGLLLVAMGVVIGSAAAWGLTRFLRSLLYQTNAADPLVYGAVALLLALGAGLGCWLPARRAMRADVAKLLRTE